MPWKPNDAPRHTKKANTPAKKAKWAKVANSALKSCQAKTGNDCEGYAIRVANSAMSQEEVKMTKNEKIPKGALCLVDPECQSTIELKDKGEDKTPQLNMVLYSGKVIKGHWWWGDLAIDINGVSLSKSKLPLLESHDTARKVGFTNKVKFDDNKIVVGPEGVTFVKTPTADEFIDLSRQGFPFEASLRGKPSVIQRLMEKEVAEVNGFKMKGPGTIWRKMVLEEGSICVFGYDSKTSASAFSKEEVELEIEELASIGGVNEPKEDINSRKEVKNMDRDRFIKEQPELYKEIVAEGRTEAEGEFSNEKKGLEVQIGEIKTQLGERDKKILELEKKDDIRSENERKAQGIRIWDEKLAESNIPERMYSKVRKHVSYSDFVKEDVLDVESFSKAIDTEIESWVKDGVNNEVMGSSFISKEQEMETKTLANQEKEDDTRVDNLLKLAGRVKKTS